ncbi:MFS transporter [Hominibacterium faecale]|uniref:MFS transporter n=1 Tax=Hominibacterium faecale TaxID=2839743 RepID=UPI0022B2A287|nr:MFS transporter [Hominibacterium faecale]
MGSIIKKHMHYAWLVLVGVILIRGFAGGGLNMTSSLFLAPAAAEIGTGIGRLSVYLSITSVVMVIWLPAAGKLINKYDVRKMAAAGAALQALSFAGFGLMKTVYGWYVLAIPYAMGAALIVNLLGPILINRWFAKKAGTMLGLQMAFVGLFGAVLQPFTSGLIQVSGWRDAYFMVGGGSFLILFFVSLLLLRNRPEDQGTQPYGETKNQESLPQKKAEELAITENTALRSASFYLLLFFMIAITGAGVFTQHIPIYGSVLGYSVKATGTALAFASVGSAIGSIAIGMISDRIGSLKTCYGLIGIGIAAVGAFFISSAGFFVFGTATFLHGLVSSGIMVLAPILTIQFYGQKDYEKIYAKVSMGAPLASIILIPAYGFIYDLTKSYVFVLFGILALLIAAAFCIGLGWRKRCTIEGCPGWRK